MPPTRSARATGAPSDPPVSGPAGPEVVPALPAGLRPPGPFDPWAAFHAGWDVWSGGLADAQGIARRARWRLRDLLTEAAAAPWQARRLRAAAGPAAGDPARSRLAARRAADIPLESLEPMTRADLMAHFDECCTDRRVTLAGVRDFLADPSRLGEAYLGEYAVWTSSGTTGTPGVYLHDARALAIYDALETLRLCGLGQPGEGQRMFEDLLRAPFVEAHRYAMVGATGGHFAGNASVERLRRLLPWAAANAQVFSILQPLPALVAQLNAYAPSVIATYPTAAELLAQERAAGRLGVHPQEIWVGGEQLSESVRSQVSEAFGCRVREGYGASECLSIAWDCGHGSLHVNADWVILEPVDHAFAPVPAGQPSHTVLLTNLANRVQPLIRYDLGDSVTLRRAPCPCGSAFPAIRVEGRRDETLEFDSEHGPVRLLPLALVTVMEDEAGAFEFQLIARDRRSLALRLDPHADAAAGVPLRPRCHQVLRAFLDAHQLAGVAIADDPQAPARDPVSGKLRRVLRARS